MDINRIINWNICAQFREVSEWYFLLISSVLLYWSLLCCKLCYIRSMFLFLYSQTSDGNHVALHIYWSNVNIVWYEHISNMYMYRFCYHYWLYHTDKKLYTLRFWIVHFIFCDHTNSWTTWTTWSPAWSGWNYPMWWLTGARFYQQFELQQKTCLFS